MIGMELNPEGLCLLVIRKWTVIRSVIQTYLPYLPTTHNSFVFKRQFSLLSY